MNIVFHSVQNNHDHRSRIEQSGLVLNAVIKVSDNRSPPLL
jgi:hypothetical protein